MASSSDEVRKIREDIEASATAQIKVEKSVKGMATLYGDVYKLSKQINDARDKNRIALEKNAKIEKEIVRLEKQSDQTSQDIARNLKRQLAVRKQIVSENDEVIDSYSRQLKLLKQQGTSLTNIATSITTSIAKGLKKNWGWYDKSDKAARRTAISMGLTGKNVDRFRKGLNSAAITTADIGISYEQLAKMQGRYSDNLGRALVLSTDGLNAISQISEGTLLGAEGAADLAANMDSFGMSAAAARDRVQETVDLASVMNLNATKVVKTMKDNLKLANQFNFKDGTKNMMKMAAITAKFKLDITSVASMAEKLFEPEGAVEMAASLQVLGGSFSKLADPFKLMFMARNDMEGLQDSIVKATAGIAIFNKESGEFGISAQELHRLRYVAEATGIPLEQLSETAREYAKVDMAKKQISADIDPKYEDFITSAAQWNKDKDGMVITYVAEDGQITEKLIKNLNNDTLKRIATEKKLLEDRAKKGKTLSETWGNLLTKLQTSLLPLLQGLDKTMREPLNDFVKWLNDKNVVDKLQSVGQSIGETVVSVGAGIVKVGKFLAEHPKAIVGALAGGAIAMGLFELGKWYANGVMMGKGFNSMAGGRGGMGGGKSITSKSGKQINQYTKSGKVNPQYNMAKNMGKGGKGFKLGKGMGGGFGLGMGGLALDLANQGMMAGGVYGEGSGLDKGLSTLATGAEYAGVGAMLGSVIPGVGTAIGGGIGGAIGLGKGVYDNYFSGPENTKVKASSANPYDNEAHDFISRPGEGLTKIDSADTVVGAKKGGPLDNALGGGGNMTVDFKPLKIEFGTIDLKMNGNSFGNINLGNDPHLTRELSRIIQEEVRMAIGGGKLSPNVG